MLRYYRSVGSLTKWQKGREMRAIPDEYASAYLKDIKQGTGLPSLWLAESECDLEKIALGILLRKGNLDNIRLVGFDSNCFSTVGIQVKQKDDLEFPVHTVCHLHHELSTSEDEKLKSAIEIFFRGEGGFKEFFKSNLKDTNMRLISAKHIGEVTDAYKGKAQEWGRISS
ncbi:hypothetical protein [Synechocystis sp. PCC 7509]|uniref:hypothetical protein n=1 Tax=Synechocystis sp. PCC 7509 TaxID=927677 RepID=UPI0002ACEA0F|nr:hypothetical protein [Synechocystis sp. PCC 7509]